MLNSNDIPTTINKEISNKSNHLPILLPNTLKNNYKPEDVANISIPLNHNDNNDNENSNNIQGLETKNDEETNKMNKYVAYKKDGILVPKPQKKIYKKVSQSSKDTNLLLSRTASRREADRLRKAKSRSNKANAVFEASRERVKRRVKSKYKSINIKDMPDLSDLPIRQPCHDCDIFYHISPYEDPLTIDLYDRYYNSGIQWPKFVQDIMKFISHQSTILNAVRASSSAKYNKWLTELKEKEEEIKLLFEAKIYYHERRESDYKEAWLKFCEENKASKEDIDTFYLRLEGLEQNVLKNRRMAEEFWTKNKVYFDLKTASSILGQAINDRKLTLNYIQDSSNAFKKNSKSKDKSTDANDATENEMNPQDLLDTDSKKMVHPSLSLNPSPTVLNSVLAQLNEHISDNNEFIVNFNSNSPENENKSDENGEGKSDDQKNKSDDYKNKSEDRKNKNDDYRNKSDDCRNKSDDYRNKGDNYRNKSDNYRNTNYKDLSNNDLNTSSGTEDEDNNNGGSAFITDIGSTSVDNNYAREKGGDNNNLSSFKSINNLDTINSYNTSSSLSNSHYHQNTPQDTLDRSNFNEPNYNNSLPPLPSSHYNQSTTQDTLDRPNFIESNYIKEGMDNDRNIITNNTSIIDHSDIYNNNGNDVSINSSYQRINNNNDNDVSVRSSYQTINNNNDNDISVRSSYQAINNNNDNDVSVRSSYHTINNNNDNDSNASVRSSYQTISNNGNDVSTRSSYQTNNENYYNNNNTNRIDNNENYNISNRHNDNDRNIVDSSSNHNFGNNNLGTSTENKGGDYIHHIPLPPIDEIKLSTYNNNNNNNGNYHNNRNNNNNHSDIDTSYSHDYHYQNSLSQYSLNQSQNNNTPSNYNSSAFNIPKDLEFSDSVLGDNPQVRSNNDQSTSEVSTPKVRNLITFNESPVTTYQMDNTYNQQEEKSFYDYSDAKMKNCSTIPSVNITPKRSSSIINNSESLDNYQPPYKRIHHNQNYASSYYFNQVKPLPSPSSSSRSSQEYISYTNDSEEPNYDCMKENKNSRGSFNSSSYHEPLEPSAFYD